MTSKSQAAWLFTRGQQSVRLVRDDDSKECHLFLFGPGTEIETYSFADVTECMKRQAAIELNLLAAGYQLERSSSDRRSQKRAGHGQDHLRAS